MLSGATHLRPRHQGALIDDVEEKMERGGGSYRNQVRGGKMAFMTADRIYPMETKNMTQA